MAYYIDEAALWYSFTETEQRVLSKMIRRFRAELITAGFLPDDKGDADGEDRF